MRKIPAKDIEGKMEMEKFRLHYYLGKNKAGLVTSFRVCENFKNVPDHEGYGLWKFDGDSIDCEPEWVDLKEDHKVAKDIDRWTKIWNEQHDSVKEEKKKHEDAIDELIKAAPWSQTEEIEDSKPNSTKVKRSLKYLQKKQWEN
jgi:hypothetical protein